MQSLDFPSQLSRTGRDDYELCEQEDEFVLSVELPGFDPEEITAEYHNGILEVTLPVQAEATATGTEIPVES